MGIGIAQVGLTEAKSKVVIYDINKDAIQKQAKFMGH
jgi:3-hydroxyacyl-CoA dehydrogenase